MEQQTFSIVIPTHNRSSLVASLLTTVDIAREEFSGTASVIVVDSSSGKEADAIKRLCADHGALYLRGTNHVGVKRNLAIREATGRYVLFTDSDCEVLPDILTRHAEAYELAAQDVAGVLGVTINVESAMPIWRVLRLDSSFTAAFSFARWLEYAPWGTCTNISFRRDVLLQVGGFDEDWPLVVYGEDVDLGLRINDARFRIRCNPRAMVWHNSITMVSLAQVLRKKYLCGRADYHLGRRHPGLLAPEFPGWAGLGLVTLLVLAVRSLVTHSGLGVLWGVACLLIGVLCQAMLTTKAAGTGWHSLLRHAAVILFEATFELGRLVESFRHGDSRRLWTKFVYVEQQLVGEREKRIRQMWACIFSLSCLVALVLGRAAS